MNANLKKILCIQGYKAALNTETEKRLKNTLVANVG